MFFYKPLLQKRHGMILLFFWRLP